MPCKLCKKQAVWKFTNQQQLCESCFVNYFESKVKKTIRKHGMPINALSKNNLKAKVINNIIKNLPERKGKLSEENLDHVSTGILYIMMHGNAEKLKTLLPKNQPLYFLSDKEVLLYAKLKGIKGKLGKNRKLAEINDFIAVIEQKSPDLRQNVVNAVLRNLS